MSIFANVPLGIQLYTPRVYSKKSFHHSVFQGIYGRYKVHGCVWPWGQLTPAARYVASSCALYHWAYKDQWVMLLGRPVSKTKTLVMVWWLSQGRSTEDVAQVKIPNGWRLGYGFRFRVVGYKCMDAYICITIIV